LAAGLALVGQETAFSRERERGPKRSSDLSEPTSSASAFARRGATRDRAV